MSETTHICASCGLPVDTGNYRMKQVGTVTRRYADGNCYEAPAYRMVHHTCPAWHGVRAETVTVEPPARDS